MMEEEQRIRAILICLDDSSVVLKTEYIALMTQQAPRTSLEQTAGFVARQLRLEGEHWALCRCRFGKNGAELMAVPSATLLCDLEQPLSLALTADETLYRACQQGEE